jgi:hypothetical protein
MRPWLTLLSWFVSCLVSRAAASNSSTDWFHRAGSGVFPVELTRSVQAQFVRVSALKPEGPDQKGAQVAVAELEVYE